VDDELGSDDERGGGVREIMSLSDESVGPIAVNHSLREADTSSQVITCDRDIITTDSPGSYDIAEREAGPIENLSVIDYYPLQFCWAHRFIGENPAKPSTRIGLRLMKTQALQVHEVRQYYLRSTCNPISRNRTGFVQQENVVRRRINKFLMEQAAGTPPELHMQFHSAHESGSLRAQWNVIG
jgi:hypothetical protein